MRLAPLLVIAALALTAPVTAHAAPGDLVAAFGGGTQLLPVAPGSNNTQILDTAVRPNGRVLVAGVAYQDGELADGDGFVAEFEPTGELNDDFGTGGIQLIAVNIVADGDDIVFDIEIADDGTVVGTGTPTPPAGPTSSSSSSGRRRSERALRRRRRRVHAEHPGLRSGPRRGRHERRRRGRRRGGVGRP